jgi:hypothetical protein
VDERVFEQYHSAVLWVGAEGRHKGWGRGRSANRTRSGDAAARPFLPPRLLAEFRPCQRVSCPARLRLRLLVVVAKPMTALTYRVGINDIIFAMTH